MAVDFSTEVGKVRALIPDIEQVPNPANPAGPAEYMLSDQHLEALLAQAGGSTFRAAGLACDAIAMSEAIVSKVITTEDLATDGAKLMNAMRTKATAFYAMADRADDAEEDSFSFVPYYLSHYEVH
jgi:hypothetical protein